MSSALCVPSMGAVLKGFKSPVNRMNIEEQKELLTMKSTTRGQLRKGDRPWEGAGAKRRQLASEAMLATLWESCQTMNKNLIRGRQSGKSWHKQATKRSAVVITYLSVIQSRR